MANTFSQIHIQVVFAVKGRENLLLPEWRTDLFQYISGMIRAKEQKAIIVNGIGDHVHALIGLRPTIAISDLVRDIKSGSSAYINDRKLVQGRFQWQEGFGVFSYSKSQVQAVYQYILNQEQHHQKRSFKKEYTSMLEKNEITFEDRYLFDWIENPSSAP